MAAARTRDRGLPVGEWAEPIGLFFGRLAVSQSLLGLAAKLVLPAHESQGKRLGVILHVGQVAGEAAKLVLGLVKLLTGFLDIAPGKRVGGPGEGIVVDRIAAILAQGHVDLKRQVTGLVLDRLLFSGQLGKGLGAEVGMGGLALLLSLSLGQVAGSLGQFLGFLGAVRQYLARSSGDLRTS